MFLSETQTLLLSFVSVILAFAGLVVIAVEGRKPATRAKQDCLIEGWARLRNRRHRTSCGD